MRVVSLCSNDLFLLRRFCKEGHLLTRVYMCAWTHVCRARPHPQRSARVRACLQGTTGRDFQDRPLREVSFNSAVQFHSHSQPMLSCCSASVLVWKPKRTRCTDRRPLGLCAAACSDSHASTRRSLNGVVAASSRIWVQLSAGAASHRMAAARCALHSAMTSCKSRLHLQTRAGFDTATTMTNALSVLNQQLKCELCLKPCCPAMLAGTAMGDAAAA